MAGTYGVPGCGAHGPRRAGSPQTVRRLCQNAGRRHKGDGAAARIREVNMPNPVVHWAIMARNAQKRQEFYASLFGWQVDSSNPMGYGFVDTHTEADINGGIPQADENEHTGVILYVEVDDLQAYLDRAEELGGSTLMPPTEIPGIVTIAFFADPEGNTTGLVKSEQPS